MYYVNQEQIEARLSFVPFLAEATRELERIPNSRSWTPAESLAQERALHLAVEVVTDVGSLLIDGFLMRDASSYEDIVEILRGEQVFAEDMAERLAELVKLRRPLVQDYASLERGGRHPQLSGLAELLTRFADDVRRYLKAEL